MKLPKLNLTIGKKKSTSVPSDKKSDVVTPAKGFNFQAFFDELKSLQNRDPGTWPVWSYRAGSIILALIVFFVAGYFLTWPNYQAIDGEEQKEVALKQDFEAKQQKVAALDAYKAQLNEMEHSFSDMLRQLPSKTEVATLLNDISQARAAAGLSEELFQPQSEVVKDFYAIIPNHITVRGDFLQMGTFAGAVAALPRIVTISDVTLVPIDSKGSPASPNALPTGLLRMDAQVLTYRYLDDSELKNQEANKSRAKKAQETGASSGKPSAE